MQVTGCLLASSAVSRSTQRIRSKLPGLCLHSCTSRISGSTARFVLSSQSRNVSARFLTSLNQIKEPGARGAVFIFRSSATDPYINLSIEHYLLQNAHPESRILFLYVNRPCVVIGRNQNPWVECALQKLSQELPNSNGNDDDGNVLLVRRRSGGGAVFHDQGNLNYSVIVPSHAKAEFKRKTHAEMVVRAVREVQRDLTLVSTPAEGMRPAGETRVGLGTGAAEMRDVRVNDRNDIVMVDGSRRGVLKVSGSAFKLTRRRALHHGTLLFSSPNLKNIGAFLRSPARDFVSAKGVESVRSPVGNLFDIPDDPQHREMLRWHLEAAVASEFRKMYGQEANARIGNFEVGSHITTRRLPEDIGPEADESSEAGAEIMKGVREIISPEWKFEQTPGFVVSTRAVASEKGFSPPTSPKGLPEGTNVLFRVKHGVLQEVDLSLATGEGSATQEEEQIKSRLQGKKLHELADWKAIFLGLSTWNQPNSGRLADWLSNTFPPLSISSIQMSERGPTRERIGNETQEAKVLRRERSDGVIELEEQGERVVEELGSPDGSWRM